MVVVVSKDYPCEYLVKIENEPFILGRITVNKLTDSFFIEIDLIQKDSRKILKHLESIYDLDDDEEGLREAFEKLKGHLS